jgi:hypothetical protein
VDELACSLHCPTVCSHQRGGQSFLIGVAMSHHAVVGGDAFSGDAKPPGVDIWRGVDRPGTCEIESCMEKLAFTRACLSDVRVVMVIMRVPLVELLCQAVMGQIPTLEYLPPDTCAAYGHALSCQVVNVVGSQDPGAW